MFGFKLSTARYLLSLESKLNILKIVLSLTIMAVALISLAVFGLTNEQFRFVAIKVFIIGTILVTVCLVIQWCISALNFLYRVRALSK